jgi:hypothetical protein
MNCSVNWNSKADGESSNHLPVDLSFSSLRHFQRNAIALIQCHFKCYPSGKSSSCACEAQPTNSNEIHGVPQCKRWRKYCLTKSPNVSRLLSDWSHTDARRAAQSSVQSGRVRSGQVSLTSRQVVGLLVRVT